MTYRTLISQLVYRYIRKPHRDVRRPNLVADSLHRFIREYKLTGRILNIGANAAQNDPLHFQYFREHRRECSLLGINIDSGETGRYGNFIVINANAHDMPFQDNFFDGILCNAMLEHDPQFWKTLTEIRRVLKIGGVLIAGVPGFLFEPLQKWCPFLPGAKAYKYDLSQATLTYTGHNAPGDYYRFSEKALKEVIFPGFEDVSTAVVMRPPRILGAGRKRNIF